MKLVKTIVAVMLMSVITGEVYAADAVSITGLSKGAKVGTIKTGGLRTQDRFKFAALSDELSGLQCVSVPRGNWKNPGAEYSFKVDASVTVYLLVDARNGKFNADGWQKTKLNATWSGTHKDNIYKRDFPAGTITIPANPAKILPNTAVVKSK
jgi:hypothetical protein